MKLMIIECSDLIRDNNNFIKYHESNKDNSEAQEQVTKTT